MLRSRSYSIAVATTAFLCACGSETPETIRYPAAPTQPAAMQDATPPQPPQPSYEPQVGARTSAPGSDGTLAAMVESAIAAEPELNNLGIAVMAVDGTVYLRGEARTRESRRLATQVASSVDGVKHVQNELFVMAGSGPQERRGGDLAVLR